MCQSNPVFIPRNHQVERVIKQATDNNNYKPMEELLEVVLNPYEENPSLKHLMEAPKQNERVTATFCGT